MRCLIKFAVCLLFWLLASCFSQAFSSDTNKIWIYRSELTSLINLSQSLSAINGQQASTLSNCLSNYLIANGSISNLLNEIDGLNLDLSNLQIQLDQSEQTSKRLQSKITQAEAALSNSQIYWQGYKDGVNKAIGNLEFQRNVAIGIGGAGLLTGIILLIVHH